MVATYNKWKLGYVLANLEIKESFETNSNTIALVPFNDPRLIRIQEVSKGAKKLLNGFHDDCGQSVYPSAVIYHDSAPEKIKSRTAMVDFRNCVAMSCILPGWGKMNLTQKNSPLSPLWSDLFDFYPVFVSSRDTLTIMNPALEIGSSGNAPFEGMPSPYVKQPFYQFIVDTNLLSKLIFKWEERYFAPGTDNWNRRKLFRSLEMAYRALALPVRNEGSINDFGSSLALWISAFEILAHPSKEWVNRNEVLKLLHKARWHNSNLYDLVKQLCKILYAARNAFIHGDVIHAKHWRYKGRTITTALGNIAPVLYRTALMSYLGWPRSGSTGDLNDRINEITCDGVYENFLMQFVTQSD